mgnify:CR=1 FL=1
MSTIAYRLRVVPWVMASKPLAGVYLQERSGFGNPFLVAVMPAIPQFPLSVGAMAKMLLFSTVSSESILLPCLPRVRTWVAPNRQSTCPIHAFCL